MSDLNELYKQIVIDHYRNPRNRGRLVHPPALYAQGFNPLCGDDLHIYIETDNDIITDVKFDGVGCSISLASASMMSVAIKNQPITHAVELNRIFKTMLAIPDIAESQLTTGPQTKLEVTDLGAVDTDIGHVHEEQLGDLISLQGVLAFPVRIKCAVLAWNTLDEALKTK